MNPLPRTGRRLLVCVRGNCAEPEQGKRVERRLAQLIAEHGLDDEAHPLHTTCTITNCLGICENGPIVVVHPDGIKYHNVTLAALEQIFNAHLLGQQPVEALIIQRF